MSLTATTFLDLVTYLVDSPDYSVNLTFTGMVIEGIPTTTVEIYFDTGRIKVSLEAPILLSHVNDLETELSQPGYTDYELEINVHAKGENHALPQM